MMPAAYTSNATVGTGAPIYWWGTNAAAVIDHTKGFVWPYLQVPLDADGVMECPEQPWGSYQPQGAAQQVTSTYGYNGYYLSPAHTPGWSFAIGNRPWQQASTVRDPARVFAFADAAIDLGGSLPRNSALLDPPVLYQGFGWAPNGSPTTSFRHRNRTHARPGISSFFQSRIDNARLGLASSPTSTISSRKFQPALRFNCVNNDRDVFVAENSPYVATPLQRIRNDAIDCRSNRACAAVFLGRYTHDFVERQLLFINDVDGAINAGHLAILNVDHEATAEILFVDFQRGACHGQVDLGARFALNQARGENKKHQQAHRDVNHRRQV